jgi:hypothetical protein
VCVHTSGSTDTWVRGCGAHIAVRTLANERADNVTAELQPQDGEGSQQHTHTHRAHTGSHSAPACAQNCSNSSSLLAWHTASAAAAGAAAAVAAAAAEAAAAAARVLAPVRAQSRRERRCIRARRAREPVCTAHTAGNPVRRIQQHPCCHCNNTGAAATAFAWHPAHPHPPVRRRTPGWSWPLLNAPLPLLLLLRCALHRRDCCTAGRHTMCDCNPHAQACIRPQARCCRQDALIAVADGCSRLIACEPVEVVVL